MAAPEFPEIELAMMSKAVSGDAGALYRIASDLMEEGVPFDSILFDYLLATERSVGQRWAQGDYLVAEEHAVTAAIESVISLLVGMFDHPHDAPSVVIATAVGDHHSLPARAAAAHLLYLGYKTTFLGSNIPAEDLREFLETDPPAALVLSGAMTTHLLGARSVVAAAHEVGVPVVAGGNAFGPDGRWAPVAGVDVYVDSFRAIAEVVDTWANDGPPELARQPELSDPLQSLVARRASILASIEGGFGDQSARLIDEAGLLLGAIEGALLTDDEQVISDMLDWQQRSLTAYGLEPDLVTNAVDRALAELPEARLVLSRARESRTES